MSKKLSESLIVAFTLTTFAPLISADHQHKNQGIPQRLAKLEAKMDRILGDLDTVLGDLDTVLGDLERIEKKIDGPTTSATFCISQGRGLELAGEWAVGLEAEVSVGIGWAAGFDGNATGEVDIPLVPVIPLPVPPFAVPLPPIPTEGKIEVAGGLGRGTDICVELPVILSEKEENRLHQLALDINAEEEGKFQRRTSRILNYANLRVNGVDLFSNAQRNGPISSNAEQDVENEFDRADAAGDSLLDGGFGEMFEGLDVFRDNNIRELLATLEIPVEVSGFMNDPERGFGRLPGFEGDGSPLCGDAGISLGMRGNNERLDRLCTRLENLPTFDRLRNADDRIEDAIAEVLNNVNKVADDAKTSFCNSRIGQRPVFNRYCNR